MRHSVLISYLDLREKSVAHVTSSTAARNQLITSQAPRKQTAVVSRLDNDEAQTSHSDLTIATELGVSLKKYGDMTREISAYKSVSFQEDTVLDDLPGEESENPLHSLEEADEKSIIKSMLQRLPKREQIILALYYNDQMNLKEIAEIMDLTEARISQIHSMCLAKLKRTFETYEFSV